MANNPTELVAAFDEIILGIRSCEVTLNGNGSDPSAGSVTLNGAPLQYGTDWTTRDSSTLELLGASCQTWLNEADVALEVEFPCGVVVL